MFWNNLYDLCKKKSTTPSAVVKELGISAGSVTKWKNGTIPSKATLVKLAAYFGVSVEYFFVDNTSLTTVSISAKELSLLEAYRTHPEMQHAVGRLLEMCEDGDIYLYTAACSCDKKLDTVVSMDTDDFKNMKEAPETDQKLS